MAQPARQRIIVVLAMHRSGSSAVTRGLKALGVDLGDTLMGPVPGNNERGFWEDLDIYRFSERLLEKARSNWHALGRLDADALTGPDFADERREAAQILSSKMKMGKIFGFKDPRTAVLMPFWRRAFDDLALDDRYLIVVRNPMECAESLQRRDGLPTAKGVMLWAKHVLEAVRQTNDKRRVFVSYENMLNDCAGELTRIARALELPAPAADDAGVQEYCRDFLSRGLRHYEYSEGDIARSGEAPSFIRDLSRRVEQYASAPDGDFNVDNAAFRKIERRHAEFAPVLEVVDFYDRTCAAARQETKELEARADNTIRQLTDERDQSAKRASTLEAELLKTREKAAADLRKTKEDAAAELRKARQETKDLEAALLKTREKAAADLRKTRANAGVELRKVKEGAAAELRKAKENAAREYARLNAKIADQAGAYKALTRDYRLARAEVRALRTSTSWRVTAPLRAAVLIARNPIGGARRVIGGLARRVWRALPMPPAARGQLAGRLFRAAPFLFFWSSAYKAWRREQNLRKAEFRYAANEELLAPPVDPDLERAAPLTAKAPPAALAARAIAFYLPQFHAIPENDAWWGEGFTEWAKVRPAKPLFQGHYQPREPGELGYYDLVKDETILPRQAELARLHGLSGFCFYFYWFGGKTLLEAPLERYLASKEIDFPFCLCWANENWTRRWDGREDDILISQNHSPEDDIAFIDHVSRYLRDPRYIKVKGRPLLVVYRPSLLPAPKETAARWREWCRDNGIGEICLAYTQSFEARRPGDYGFDAAIEFPPNNSGLAHEPELAPGLPEDSAVCIYDWRKSAARCLQYEKAPFTLFRGVNPSWDNTPRRPRDGAVLVNSSPSGYKAWLAAAAADAKARFDDPDERLVFINAWNEWAEGACLEPDKRYGYAWLEATRRALDASGERKILIVTHDLHKHGAQYLALNMARTLRRRYGLETAAISGGDGALEPDYLAEGPLTVFDAKTANAEDVDRAVADLAARGFRHAIVNSSASGWIAPALARRGFEMIGLVHEMPSMIEKMNLKEGLRALDAHARAVVFPAAVVRDGAAGAAGLKSWTNAKVLPQGVYKPHAVSDLGEKKTARRTICRTLGLPETAFIVLGVGYGDRRKGVDIFARWALAAAARWPAAHFIWLGEIDPEMREVCERLMQRQTSRRGNVHFPGFAENTRDYYLAARLYALTSREDPFPSTALEALAAATPVVMIKGTGGIEDLAPEGCVRLAASPSSADFLTEAAEWIEHEDKQRAAGQAGRDLMRSRFGFTSYMGALTDLLGAPAPNISVIVPNYNYARHLEQRLKSILDQTLSPREIIFLDDASTDDSVAVAERLLCGAPVNWRIIRNEENSGDVFAQWRKGAAMAKGDIVWIAEADDWADPRFLETAVKAFAREDVVLSFTQSNQVDEAGRVTARDYHDYVRDVSPVKWTSAFINDGPAEVREGLSVKNTIPNVSAVLFRKTALVETLTAYARDIGAYRVAGDWCVYVNLLRQGAAAFSPEPLNYHRRHDESVTIGRFDLPELAEIARMQAYVAEHFSPPPETAAKARSYLEGLIRHFGLEKRYRDAEISAAMAGSAA